MGNGKFWANEGTRLPRNFRTGDKILNPPIRTAGETGRRVGVSRVGVDRIGESFPPLACFLARKLERVQTILTPTRPYAS